MVSWETKKTSWLFYKNMRLERFEMVYHSEEFAKGRGRSLVSTFGLTGAQECLVNHQKRNLLLDLSSQKGMLSIDTEKQQRVSCGNCL